jgi:hypothetical protein
MTVQIIIDINDYASAGARDLQKKIDYPQGMLQRAGKAIEVCLRDHFLRRNSQPNKMGWTPRNFWSRIRNATAFVDATNQKATVAIADPAINQKVFGGTIKPQRVSNLALPATAMAYAAGSPREGGTPALKFMFAFDPGQDRWRPALVAAENYARRLTRGKRKGELTKAQGDKATEGVGVVWYWLVRKVTQDADPAALPSDNDIQAAIYGSVESYLKLEGTA